MLAGGTAPVAGAMIANGDGGMDRWRAAIVLWEIAPPFVAWESGWNRQSAAARLPVLWFALLPAAFATMVSYLVLAPSLLLMVAAAVLAATEAPRYGVPRAPRGTAGGVLFVAGWAFGFVALFAIESGRCREFATGVSCTSDVVTIAEVGLGLVLLSAGVAAALLLPRSRGRRAPTQGA